MATTQSDRQQPDSPFHAGELAVQERAGAAAQSAITGRRGIRDHMPDQHREFFAQLRLMLVGSVDASGQPWASVLVVQAGFVRSPDPRTLRTDAQPLPGDIPGVNLHTGARLGSLGLEPQTRRRNRLNGAVAAVGAEGFPLGVTQSFGNCPRYIQGRISVKPQSAPWHWLLEHGAGALVEALGPRGGFAFDRARRRPRSCCRPASGSHQWW
jgi:predicted pyridoxine 5'-phosphate oxidase superfamily flavin-nucleotide-binding protein